MRIGSYRTGGQAEWPYPYVQRYAIKNVLLPMERLEAQRAS